MKLNSGNAAVEYASIDSRSAKRINLVGVKSNLRSRKKTLQKEHPCSSPHSLPGSFVYYLSVTFGLLSFIHFILLRQDLRVTLRETKPIVRKNTLIVLQVASVVSSCNISFGTNFISTLN